MDENLEMAEGEKPTESGGRSIEEAREPSMASPRFIPVLGSPYRSAEAYPELALDGTGHTSESFGRLYAPSQLPRCESANNDHPSYDQLHELCRRRSYHKKNAKAAPETRSVAMDAAGRRPLGGAENDMDKSSSVSGKRARTLEEPSTIETPVMGMNGKRPRGDALAAALAAGNSVVHEHAQR